MSKSNSDSSSFASKHKTFWQISRDRLLYEMIRSAKIRGSRSNRKVLIIDELTVKILSLACKSSDINEEGVPLVEDIRYAHYGCYLFYPAIERECHDVYVRAFVFSSSPISKELVTHIKENSTMLARMGALREMNLEYFAFDSQSILRAGSEINTMDSKGSNLFCLENGDPGAGDSVKKEVLLDESDPVWLELRHAHIADASERLHEKMTNFVANNRAVQIQHGSRI